MLDLFGEPGLLLPETPEEAAWLYLVNSEELTNLARRAVWRSRGSSTLNPGQVKTSDVLDWMLRCRFMFPELHVKIKISRYELGRSGLSIRHLSLYQGENYIVNVDDESHPLLDQLKEIHSV